MIRTRSNHRGRAGRSKRSRTTATASTHSSSLSSVRSVFTHARHVLPHSTSPSFVGTQPRRMVSTASLSSGSTSPAVQSRSSFHTAFHSPQTNPMPEVTISATNELRSSFIGYFKQQDHLHLPSSSVVPVSDPSLLFTSAGMVPFKNVFLGIEPPPSGHRRVTTSQRCIRAGGKHNDLDNVGYTARHHTFFEMLGNFSFGDYFKEEAIFYAWQYLTKELQLPKDRLMVSVFETDDDAAKLWTKISGLTEASGRLRRMGAEDNFWQMGDTGPCGPCSEIYFDQLRNVDGERFLEIWNLVFMQYNRDNQGVLHPLTHKCVDTGMGLERLAAVMQGVTNNFDGDQLLSIVNAIGHDFLVKQEKQTQPVRGSHNPDLNTMGSPSPSTPSDHRPHSSTTEPNSHGMENSPQITATRVVADHLRAILAMLYDGVQPSSSGRGYVLRRILRRAYKYGLSLGFNEPFLHTYVDLVTELMDDAIPGIHKARHILKNDILREEQIFSSSMAKGMKIIQDYMNRNGIPLLAECPSDGHDSETHSFPVDLAFQLYDSHGFPVDLTELCVKDYHCRLDVDQVEQLLQKRRAESRLTWNNSSSAADLQQQLDGILGVWKSNGVESQFIGYESLDTQTRVLDIIPLKQSDLPGSQVSYVISLEKTPFYPIGGGQVADSGVIVFDVPVDLDKHTTTKDGSRYASIYSTVKSVSKSGNTIALLIEVDTTPLSEDSQSGVTRSNLTEHILHPDTIAFASVDSSLRSQTSVHHTTTHLLQAALQRVLGQSIEESGDHDSDHVTQASSSIRQAGSHVAPTSLRFDFGFNRPLTNEEVQRVEDQVNSIALRALPVKTAHMSLDDAKNLGAMSLFGEKYDQDDVRVVSIPLDMQLHERFVANVHETGATRAVRRSTLPDDQRSQDAHPTSSKANSLLSRHYSIELCGGTHVANTLQCYPFIIVGENGVSSGTRRIEALAGTSASQYLLNTHQQLKSIKTQSLLRLHHLADVNDVTSSVTKMKGQYDDSQKRIKDLQQKNHELTLAMMRGGVSAASQLASSLTNDITSSQFWVTPTGWKLSAINFNKYNQDTTVSSESNMQANITPDVKGLKVKYPIILFYAVPSEVSSEYGMYRKISEDLLIQQVERYMDFMSKNDVEIKITSKSDATESRSTKDIFVPAELPTFVHVFIGSENGKSFIFTQDPLAPAAGAKANKKKKGPSPIDGGEPGTTPDGPQRFSLPANELWKIIQSKLPQTKGGGTANLAQGTIALDPNEDTLAALDGLRNHIEEVLQQRFEMEHSS